MFGYKEKHDFSYYGERYSEDGEMAIKYKYKHGPIDYTITIKPTDDASKAAKIIRVTRYDDGEEPYIQRFDISRLVGRKRYVMSDSYPIVEIECLNENEYKVRINALYMSEVTSELITFEKGSGGVVFFDGDNRIGLWTTEGEGVRADFDKESLPFAHLLILPVLYLLVMPSEKSTINSDMRLLFNKVNERTEYYLKEMRKLSIKDLMRDVHQPDDYIDLAISPRANIMAAIRGYWTEHLMMAAEIETFRERIIGMWTPEGIIEGDRYMQHDISDQSITARLKPYLE